MRYFILILVCLASASLFAQDELAVMGADDHYVKPETLMDPVYGIVVYERLNGNLGGDSTRHCNGYACTGWVEDRYSDGTVMHKGYYDDGQLIMYRNYYPNAVLEREFKVVDNLKCMVKKYYSNGELKSLVKYHRGEPFVWQDHYENGQLQYDEEKDKQSGTYVRSNTYAANGTPINTMELENKKRMEYIHKEYHINGQVKLEGSSRYIESLFDHRRVGVWKHYNIEGKLVQEDTYRDGKISGQRKF